MLDGKENESVFLFLLMWLFHLLLPYDFCYSDVHSDNILLSPLTPSQQFLFVTHSLFPKPHYLLLSVPFHLSLLDFDLCCLKFERFSIGTTKLQTSFSSLSSFIKYFPEIRQFFNQGAVNVFLLQNILKRNWNWLPLEKDVSKLGVEDKHVFVDKFQENERERGREIEREREGRREGESEGESE